MNKFGRVPSCMFAVVLLAAICLCQLGCSNSGQPASPEPASDTNEPALPMSAEAGEPAMPPLNQDAAHAEHTYEPEHAPDPMEPITIDFVPRFDRKIDWENYWENYSGVEPMPFGGGMFGPWNVGVSPPLAPELRRPHDLHTVLHMISAKTGLQLIVEGDLDLVVSVEPPSDPTREEAMEYLHTLCKANQLDLVEDGSVIIIRKRPTFETRRESNSLRHIFEADTEGRFDVEFEREELIGAIMEVAMVTQTEVFVPSICSMEDYVEPEVWTAPPVQRWIWTTMRDATPEEILRRLALLGDMGIKEIVMDEDGRVGYEFALGETWQKHTRKD